jgi:hypothetical protein
LLGKHRNLFSAVSAPARVRAFSLVAFGALVVHQLRFATEFRGGWGEALAQQGHGYLTLVAPLVIVALAAAGFLFLVELHRAQRGRPFADGPPRERPFWVSWLLTALLISAIYVGQELAEGILASGHPPGLVGVVGEGGWTAFAFAFALAAPISLLLRRAAAAIRQAARRARFVWVVLDLSTVLPPVPDSRPLDAVARHLAGRGPPISA